MGVARPSGFLDERSFSRKPEHSAGRADPEPTPRQLARPLARSGADPTARPEYAALLSNAWERLEAQGVHQVVLNNQMSLGLCIKALIFNTALSEAGVLIDGDERMQPAAPFNATVAASKPAVASQPFVLNQDQIAGDEKRDPLFDRPVFIVSSPRSGSSLLFETLSGSADLHTIGGESHGIMEAVESINPANRDWDCNRLTTADADLETAQALRERFYSALRDRQGRRPVGGPVRMLEKTPKNALRIPFLAAVFPEAQFIYLHRDPRPTLASMMDAWLSGKFQTYPDFQVARPAMVAASYARLARACRPPAQRTRRASMGCHDTDHARRPNGLVRAPLALDPLRSFRRLSAIRDFAPLHRNGPELRSSTKRQSPAGPQHAYATQCSKVACPRKAILAVLPLVSVQNARAEAIFEAASAH